MRMKLFRLTNHVNSTVLSNRKYCQRLNYMKCPCALQNSFGTVERKLRNFLQAYLTTRVMRMSNQQKLLIKFAKESDPQQQTRIPEPQQRHSIKKNNPNIFGRYDFNRKYALHLEEKLILHDKKRKRIQAIGKVYDGMSIAGGGHRIFNDEAGTQNGPAKLLHTKQPLFITNWAAQILKTHLRINGNISKVSKPCWHRNPRNVHWSNLGVCEFQLVQTESFAKTSKSLTICKETSEKVIVPQLQPFRLQGQTANFVNSEASSCTTSFGESTSRQPTRRQRVFANKAGHINSNQIHRWWTYPENDLMNMLSHSPICSHLTRTAIEVKFLQRTLKRFFCRFICLTTRAVHVSVAQLLGIE